jgi:putative transposase
LALLEPVECGLSLASQARLLGLNRSGLYYQRVGPSEQELQLRREIDRIYTQWPFYGSRRVTVELRRREPELVVNRKQVQRLMREMGIAAVYPGPNLSRRRQQAQVRPYLLRGRSIAAPDEVWGIDITYVPLRRSWLYLVAVIDWFSRCVLAWEMADSLQSEFVLAAVRRALALGRPEILNSDQGSQFTSQDYLDLVEGAGVLVSMDGRGRALDNVFTERLWRSLKYEEVYLKEYEGPRQARHGVDAYLSFYNEQRPHQSLGYRTPTEVYAQGQAASAANT